MSMRTYHSEQLLNISIQKAWQFFSTPENLTKITPPNLGFEMLSKNLPEEVYEGMEIVYELKPFLKIPVKWKTLITEVQELDYFKDVQLIGPYAYWEHTHSFEKVEGGVLMKDDIKFKLPLGPIGDLVYSLFVKKKMEEGFLYRTQILNMLFSRKS